MGDVKTAGWFAPQNRKETIAGLLFVLPALIGFVTFVAGPMIATLVISLMKYDLFSAPTFVGLKNFQKIWNDSIFHTTVWNTFWYTGVTTVFKLALGLWLVPSTGDLGSHMTRPGEGTEARAWLAASISRARTSAWPLPSAR